MSARVPIAPSVLLWAEQRSQRDEGAYERKFPAWPEWVSGDKPPTIKQVEDLAKFSHLPFGIFFLDEPPAVELPVPDYRVGRTGAEAIPSQNLLDVIDLSAQRQAWYREYAITIGIGPASIHRATEQENPKLVAAIVAKELSFTVDERAKMSREDARNHLRRTFEQRGGLTVITSMVGNDATRMLNRDEFRGFTLGDDIAPLIFVNSSGDSLSGQIFTFLHEYAHVVLRSTGVSDEDPAVDGSRLESWCNAVASEVLVPAEDLTTQYRREANLSAELERLSRRYLCSTLVTLLKLRELGLVAREGFDHLYRMEEQRVTEAFQSRPTHGGGNFYLNQPFRIGERLSRAILADVREGGTSYSDAFRLLGLRNVDQLSKYSEQLGV